MSIFYKSKKSVLKKLFLSSLCFLSFSFNFQIQKDQISNYQSHKKIYSYNPIDDDNVVAYLLRSGNLVYNKSLIYDFQNNDGLKPAVFQRYHPTFERCFLDSYDYFGEYCETIPERWEDYTKETSYIAGGFWKGGKEKSHYKYNAEIPWVDVKSMANISKLNLDNLYLKSVTFIPEITLLNPPLNYGVLDLQSFRIFNGNEEIFYKWKISKDLTFPKEFHYSEGPLSSILKFVISGLGLGFSLIPGVNVATSAASTLSLDVLGRLIDYQSPKFTPIIQNFKNVFSKNNNYKFLNFGQNYITQQINKKLKKEESLRININEADFEAHRWGNYLWDATEAKMSKMFMHLEFENR